MFRPQSVAELGRDCRLSIYNAIEYGGNLPGRTTRPPESLSPTTFEQLDIFGVSYAFIYGEILLYNNTFGHVKATSFNDHMTNTYSRYSGIVLWL